MVELLERAELACGGLDDLLTLLRPGDDHPLRREREAVDTLYKVIPDIIARHDQNPERQFAGVDFFRQHFSDNGTPEAQLEKKVIHNVMNANQGFLSNLYAGIAWVIVRILQYPDCMAKVRSEIADIQTRYGDDFYFDIDALNSMHYLEQVTMESIRLAQRSLTLRKVMKPIEFNDGKQCYQVEPGIYLATMLSVCNVQTPELTQFNPDNYQQNRLQFDTSTLGKESISTFGHGRHACPAQRFSHHMTKIVVSKLLARFSLTANLKPKPEPSRVQMGGVSRPQQPIFMSLRAKKN